MLFDQAIDIPESLSRSDVTVSLMGQRTRFNLRVKSGDYVAVRKASGLKLPSKMNTTTLLSDAVWAKLGPDEWMVICEPSSRPKLEEKLAKLSQNVVCSVTDISHRNAGLILSGPRAAEFINVGCPLDLGLNAFPVGKVTRTVFESAQIMLLRTGEDSFHVECWRSFVPYLRDYFARIAETHA